MKRRITLTIDPEVHRKARKLARTKKTTVSGLIEELLNLAPMPEGGEKVSFVEKWAGEFQVASGSADDLRMRHLKKRYNLP